MDMTLRIDFKVDGMPQTKGSARAFMPKGARFPVVTNDNPKCKNWQGSVAQAAAQAMTGKQPLPCPVSLSLTFFLPRPKGHFGTGKNADKLKPSAPMYHATKPDLDKLVRAVKDGLKGIVYRDDAQVAALSHTSKVYDDQETIGVRVHVEELGCE